MIYSLIKDWVSQIFTELNQAKTDLVKYQEITVSMNNDLAPTSQSENHYKIKILEMEYPEYETSAVLNVSVQIGFNLLLGNDQLNNYEDKINRYIFALIRELKSFQGDNYYQNVNISSSLKINGISSVRALGLSNIQSDEFNPTVDFNLMITDESFTDNSQTLTTENV